jgi:hypothetical protein
MERLNQVVKVRTPPKHLINHPIEQFTSIRYWKTSVFTLGASSILAVADLLVSYAIGQILNIIKSIFIIAQKWRSQKARLFLVA